MEHFIVVSCLLACGFYVWPFPRSPSCPGLGQTNLMEEDVKYELVSEPGSVHLSREMDSAHQLKDGRKTTVFVTI